MNKVFNISMNLNTGKLRLTPSAISIFDTDVKIFNIYVELDLGEANMPMPVPNADLSNYTVKIFAVKPKTQEYFEITGVKDSSKDLVYFDLPAKFNSIVGKFKAEIQVTKGEETITSDPFEYTVKASVVTGLSKDITTQNVKQVNVLEGLINEVKTLSTLEFGKEEVLCDYQTKEADGLKTEANDLVGAINELYDKKNIRVVDNLITTNGQVALSAKQGNLLNEKIEKKAPINHSHKEMEMDIKRATMEINKQKEEFDKEINRLTEELNKLKKALAKKK